MLLKKEDQYVNNGHCLCIQCNEQFIYLQSETGWNEQGSVSVKLVPCPYCGQLNKIKYQYPYQKNPNMDQRYF